MKLNKEYKIEGLLGKGSQGELYLVRSLQHADKLLAMKRTDLTFGAAEEAILMHIRDKYIPKLIEKAEIDGQKYLVMEYMGTENLEKTIQESGGMTEQELILLALDLCHVLRRLHENKKPFLYLDLKPANIRMKNRRLAGLVDYGCAISRTESGEYLSKGMGTKGFAAPEQFVYMAHIDERADIYGLGAILFYAKGDKPISSGLDQILQKCCRLNKEERTVHIKEVQKELLQYKYRGMRRYMAGGILIIALLSHQIVHSYQKEVLKGWEDRYEELCARLDWEDMDLDTLDSFMKAGKEAVRHHVFENGQIQKSKERYIEKLIITLWYEGKDRESRAKACLLAGLYKNEAQATKEIRLLHDTICLYELTDKKREDMDTALQALLDLADEKRKEKNNAAVLTIDEELVKLLYEYGEEMLREEDTKKRLKKIKAYLVQVALTGTKEQKEKAKEIADIMEKLL